MDMTSYVATPSRCRLKPLINKRRYRSVGVTAARAHRAGPDRPEQNRIPSDGVPGPESHRLAVNAGRMDRHPESGAASGRSDTSRAVALAQLLHQDCKTLLELFKKRESFISHHLPEGDRLISVELCPDPSTSGGQVVRVSQALQGCKELLECLILREAEEMEEEMQGAYESARETVRERLEHLLCSTRLLLDNASGGDNNCPDSPHFQCVQDQLDGEMGSFGAKMWAYRVLLELVHWTDSATQALHELHTEREVEQQHQEL